MFGAIAGLARILLPKIFDTVDKAVLDKDAAAKLKADLQMTLLDMDRETQKAASDIVLAETNSKHSLAALWRPMLMYVSIAILFNNFILAPYAQAMFGVSVVLAPDTATLPPEMWALLNIGIGGYVGGRTAEKIADKVAPYIGQRSK